MHPGSRSVSNMMNGGVHSLYRVRSAIGTRPTPSLARQPGRLFEVEPKPGDTSIDTLRQPEMTQNRPGFVVFARGSAAQIA